MRHQDDISSLPEHILGECHAFHQRYWSKIDTVSDVTNSIYTGNRGLVEPIHLDLSLWAQLHSNLQHINMLRQLGIPRSRCSFMG